MELPVRIDENILFLQNIKIFIRYTITENAYLGYIFIYARAFDIEKYVIHGSADSMFVLI